MDYWTAFILGLVGSAHCAGMCGPLALALPTSGRTAAGFLAGRAAYNLGRVVTYCFLGALFGLLGQGLLLAGVQRWTSIALGLLLLAGLFSSRTVALWRPLASFIEALKSRMSNLLRRRSLLSLGLLGLLNGLLPCGLVYVACAGAAASSSLYAGTGYMAAFGLGTIPMLVAISLSGRLVPLNLRTHLRKALPVSVCLLATLLILRGLSLGIPYLSPDLSGAGQSCCHK
ncbi:MAG TPA: sulfite exporter TauE/SafE family protein [Verrucomicrobiae bacterium]